MKGADYMSEQIELSSSMFEIFLEFIIEFSKHQYIERQNEIFFVFLYYWAELATSDIP